MRSKACRQLRLCSCCVLSAAELYVHYAAADRSLSEFRRVLKSVSAGFLYCPSRPHHTHQEPQRSSPWAGTAPRVPCPWEALWLVPLVSARGGMQCRSCGVWRGLACTPVHFPIGYAQARLLARSAALPDVVATVPGCLSRLGRLAHVSVPCRLGSCLRDTSSSLSTAGASTLLRRHGDRQHGVVAWSCPCHDRVRCTPPGSVMARAQART